MGSSGGDPGIDRSVRSDDAAAFLIQRTARLLRVLFLRLIQSEDLDLTPEMWLVLSRLLARDGQYQNELADSTFRDRPNMSRILSGLEARGLVRRVPDEGDRRRIRIWLTASGREVVAATGPMAARTRDRLYAGLTKDEVEDLRRALRRIEENALEALARLADLPEGGWRKTQPPAR